jgi:hypothetical protein
MEILKRRTGNLICGNYLLKKEMGVGLLPYRGNCNWPITSVLHLYGSVADAMH